MDDAAMDSPTGALRSWLQQWLAPPTLIALISFGGLTFVAHYRLGLVEVEQTRIRAQLEQHRTDVDALLRNERDLNALTYQRRDVLVEQLRAVQTQLDEIKQELRRRNARGEAP